MVVSGAALASPTPTPAERRAAATSVLTAYLTGVRSGTPAPDLLCPSTAPPAWPPFTAFAVGEPRPGAGELTYPVRLSLADGDTATQWVTVRLGPRSPRICTVTTWQH